MRQKRNITGERREEERKKDKGQAVTEAKIQNTTGIKIDCDGFG